MIEGPTGKHGVEGSEAPRGKIDKMGPVGSRGSTGPRGDPDSQGAAGKIGPKGDNGDRGDQAVKIDIVTELCKHLPIAIVEQYCRGAYVRYTINSMEDVELHDRVKTIIDKGGRCNASQSDVTRMATLSKTLVNCNCVLNFHNDAYNMEADIHDVQYFCVFLVYKIKAYAKTEHWECNYLISKWTGEKEIKHRGICFLTDKKILRMHGAGGVGSDDTFDFKQIHVKRIDSKLYVWSMLRGRRVPTHHYGLMDFM